MSLRVTFIECAQQNTDPSYNSIINTSDVNYIYTQHLNSNLRSSDLLYGRVHPIQVSWGMCTLANNTSGPTSCLGGAIWIIGLRTWHASFADQTWPVARNFESRIRFPKEVYTFRIKFEFYVEVAQVMIQGNWLETYCMEEWPIKYTSTLQDRNFFK